VRVASGDIILGGDTKEVKHYYNGQSMLLATQTEVKLSKNWEKSKKSYNLLWYHDETKGKKNYGEIAKQ